MNGRRRAVVAVFPHGADDLGRALAWPKTPLAEHASGHAAVGGFAHQEARMLRVGRVGVHTGGAREDGIAGQTWFAKGPAETAKQFMEVFGRLG